MTEGAGETASRSGTAVHTFLIADLRGYTRFTLEQGDEAAAQLTQKFAAVVRDMVSARGGEVLELRGDESLAMFDSARQALRAAAELQGRLADETLADHSLPLYTGIGLDAGEAVPVDGGYRGAALNLAARLCSLAGPGEVLASEAVTHLARRIDGLEYHERGTAELKGFADPVKVMEIRPSPPSSPQRVPSLRSTRGSRDAGEGEMPVSTSSPLPYHGRGAGGEGLSEGLRLPIGGFLGSLPAGVLVARDDELRRALTLVDDVMAGNGRLLMLVGEPGVGKTRLAQEVTLQLRDRGFLIAAGSCYESRQTSAFYPWVAALGALYAQAPPDLRPEVARRWPYLGKLLPGENLAVPAASDSEEDQERLFWSVTGFVQELAEITPVALLFDDLHWADAASLNLLQHIARFTRGDRVLLLGTYRDVEVGRQHPLEAALRELNRQGLIERIAVRRLDGAGTAELMGAALGEEEITEELAALLYERTEGNPFFVQQVMRVLVEKGDLYRENGRWARKAIGEIEVPESIRSVVGQRLARLADETQETLREASVLGQRFRFDDLVEMGHEEQETERRLDEACAAGLLRTSDGETYAFDHALTQQALYAELSPRRRRRLHLAAGEAIEGMPDRKRQGRTSELAWHFVQGDDPEKALRYALQAGDEAEAVFAHAEAEMQYRTALELARERDDERLQAESLEKLCGVLQTQARREEELELLAQAAALYSRLDDLEGEGRIAARTGWAYYLLDRTREGIAAVRRILPRFEGRPPTPALFQLHEALAGLLWMSGHPEEALEAADRALAAATTLGDERSVARAQGRRGLVLQALGRPDDALEAFDVAILLSEKSGDPDTLGRALNNMAFAWLRRGDSDRFMELERRALVNARRAGNPSMTAHGLVMLGFGEWMCGAIKAWHAHLTEALEIVRHLEITEWAWLETLAAFELSVEGHEDDARARLETLASEGERTGNTALLMRARDFLAEMDRVANRFGDSLGRLEPLLENPDIRAEDVPDVLIDLAETHLWKRTKADTRAARDLLSRLPPVEAREFLSHASGLVLGAWVTAREGNRAEADRLIEEALAFVRSLKYTWLEAYALDRYGMMLAELGDVREGRERLSKAITLYRQMGAVPYTRWGEERLAGLEDRV
jgi:class 3 adenylate cyclase/tetratricopeptide (TPR) repeat protein